MYNKYFKRLVDIILSLLAITLLSPFVIIISLLILISMGEPVFYRQERPGLEEKIFRIIKFRTMNFNKDPYGNLLPDMKRVTKLGKFLRNTSLDELPELFNILRGDMSFVGPRPLLVRYLPFYSVEERKRHSVRPGLTGLAQVNGRNAITWEDKFRFDIWYVDKISFRIDIKIIFLTLLKVVKREGINSDSFHTAIPFDEYMQAKNNYKTVKS